MGEFSSVISNLTCWDMSSRLRSSQEGKDVSTGTFGRGMRCLFLRTVFLFSGERVGVSGWLVCWRRYWYRGAVGGHGCCVVGRGGTACSMSRFWHTTMRTFSRRAVRSVGNTAKALLGLVTVCGLPYGTRCSLCCAVQDTAFSGVLQAG